MQLFVSVELESDDILSSWGYLEFLFTAMIIVSGKVWHKPGYSAKKDKETIEFLCKK